jgi:uncharacterized protein DUF3631/CHC2-type zinc finger protein
MTVAEAKVALPLPALVQREGLGAHAKKSAHCPFHDDQHESFSIWQKEGKWWWKCHAGCGHGDEITFLEKLKGISSRDATKLYIEMAGGRKTVTRCRFDWDSCKSALTGKHVEEIAKERGYPLDFCFRLRDQKLVGLYQDSIAFPVHASSGAVVGCHYRIKQTGKWKYAPEGIKVAPLVVGKVNGEVHLFESQWCALALWSMFAKDAAPAVIATRGSGNSIPAATIPSGVAIYAWKQNDQPGEKWLAKILETFPQARTPIVPLPHKDFNDWSKAGLQGIDLMIAIKDAEPQRVSPEKLFNQIKDFLTRYIVFSQPHHVDAIALWVMHTWVADCADFTPYIYLHSPVMRCGKTQVHRVVEPLVKNPLRTCNVSEAALYREIEESHPTLLWDEIDSIFGNRKSSEANENKRALLNAGHERGMTTVRMERGPGGFVKISFDPFCPKILAGIGRLPDTIVDRSIPILIHRRLKSQACHKFRRQDRANAKPLHEALKTWSADADLQKRLREAHPEMPECLTDRQEDIWEPLLAIADSIGGDVPEVARAAAGTLCENEDELNYGMEQLAAIRKLIGERSRITSVDLIEGLWEADALPSRLIEDEKPNHKKIGHWLSKFIKSYGGKPARQLKFEGQNLRGYEMAELQPIFDRYCPLA